MALLYTDVSCGSTEATDLMRSTSAEGGGGGGGGGGGRTAGVRGVDERVLAHGWTGRAADAASKAVPGPEDEPAIGHTIELEVRLAELEAALR